jgi:hypothetical protein
MCTLGYVHDRGMSPACTAKHCKQKASSITVVSLLFTKVTYLFHNFIPDLWRYETRCTGFAFLWLASLSSVVTFECFAPTRDRRDRQVAKAVYGILHVSDCRSCSPACGDELVVHLDCCLLLNCCQLDVSRDTSSCHPRRVWRVDLLRDFRHQRVSSQSTLRPFAHNQTTP